MVVGALLGGSVATAAYRLRYPPIVVWKQAELAEPALAVGKCSPAEEEERNPFARCAV